MLFSRVVTAIQQTDARQSANKNPEMLIYKRITNLKTSFVTVS
jgi:hypothetical protein